MMIEKDKPIRNQKYLDWVKTLPCVLTGMPADDYHHIIGVQRGKMGGKDCDLFTIPVTRGSHVRFHNEPELWPDQWEYVAKTLRQAVKEGILEFNFK